MKDKKENTTLSYNYQVVIDIKTRIAVGHYLTQNFTDYYELFEMLRELKLM